MKVPLCFSLSLGEYVKQSVPVVINIYSNCYLEIVRPQVNDGLMPVNPWKNWCLGETGWTSSWLQIGKRNVIRLQHSIIPYIFLGSMYWTMAKGIFGWCYCVHRVGSLANFYDLASHSTVCGLSKQTTCGRRHV